MPIRRPYRSILVILDSHDTKLRKMPQQERARTTIKRILEVTGEVLDQVGFEKTNTNLIARQSRTNISSLYQYFPNKHAIIAVLRENILDQLVEVFRPFPDEFAASTNWQETLQASIALFIATANDHPGSKGLRRMQSSPLSTHPLDHPREMRITEYLSKGFALRNPALGATHCQTMARLVVQAILTLLESDSRGIILAHREIERRTEVHRMCFAYLGQYFTTAGMEIPTLPNQENSIP